MDVVQSIVKNINGYVFKLCEKMESEHGIPIEESLKIWCEQQNISFSTVFLPMIKIANKSKKVTDNEPEISEQQDEEEKIIEEEEKINSSNVCEYIFSRGPKKGTRCTILAKTGPLCSKHKK